MKIMRYLLGAVMALAMVGCDTLKMDKEVFTKLDSLVGTSWYSHDSVKNIFYDITYDTTTGRMIGYDSEKRVNEVVNRTFTYTYTHTTDDVNSLVTLIFDDGQRYSGISIPKGYVKVNLIDVYFIQLYEVDERGEVIYNADGTMNSTLQMWME